MRLLAAAVCASVVASAVPGEAAPRIPQIKFEKYCLSNGLEVIFHEDHSTPIVGVNLWYHVGSKNERPGRTGFAHLFEHMMFQGSQHHDADYFGPLQKAGGKLNGSTSQDRTNYWETVPSNYLELALWMEADRMGFLLPVMTQQRLDNQRDVVKNERRQSYENRPYGLAYETILAALYPPDHPYSWPVIGSMADLNAASREDIATFFRTYYHPGNASLCIAGDFDPAQARKLVEKYFGSLPAGPKVEKLKPSVPELKADQRIRMTDRVGLERVYLAWHSVPQFTADEAELEILADILGGGKTSRLYRSLVREKQIAQDVQVWQDSSELAGAVLVIATARPGHTAAELEAAAMAEIAKIQSEPPNQEEVTRAVNRFEARFVSALESISDFGGRADRLNMYNVYTGDPGNLTKDFDRYPKVTPAGVQRVAKEYLGRHRVAFTVVPGKKVEITPDPRKVDEEVREQLAKKQPPQTRVTAGEPKDTFDRSRMPGPAPESKFTLPPIHRARLSNGLELLLVENHELPTVNMHLVLRSGRASDPADKAGLAGLTASVWDEGTKRRSSDEIAEELAGLGATLHMGVDWDTAAVRLFSLKRHLAAALDIYSDVVENPVFPERELARERAMALGRLVQIRDEPTILANMAVGAVLYGPEHPYGRPQYGTEESLKSIDRGDLERFYRAGFRPDRAALVVVGDVTIEELKPQLEKYFADWRAPAGRPVEPKYPPRPAPRPSRIILVDKPGSVQSVISVSQVGTERTSPDYFAIAVMNSIFGGQFSSRLNMNLREEKGYTYGARTSFDWRADEPGPLTATASVQTQVTAPALTEFLKEFQGMVGAKPVTADELEFSKTYLTRGYPAGFETPSQVASQLETMVQFRLPDDYFNTVVPKIHAVSTEDVSRVARKYLHVDELAAVIVGDREQIEPELRKLPIGKRMEVVRFNEQFQLVPVEGP